MDVEIFENNHIRRSFDWKNLQKMLIKENIVTDVKKDIEWTKSNWKKKRRKESSEV